VPKTKLISKSWIATAPLLPAKASERKTSVYLNIDKSAHDNLRTLATENNRSMSNLMEWLLQHPKIRSFLRNDLRDVRKILLKEGYELKEPIGVGDSWQEDEED
jgi:hypothetical protein